MYIFAKECARARGVMKRLHFYFQFNTSDDEKLLNGPVVELVCLDLPGLVFSIFQYHLHGTFLGFQENSFYSKFLFFAFCLLKLVHCVDTHVIFVNMNTNFKTHIFL